MRNHFNSSLCTFHPRFWCLDQPCLHSCKGNPGHHRGISSLQLSHSEAINVRRKHTRSASPVRWLFIFCLPYMTLAARFHWICSRYVSVCILSFISHFLAWSIWTDWRCKILRCCSRLTPLRPNIRWNMQSETRGSVKIYSTDQTNCSYSLRAPNTNLKKISIFCRSILKFAICRMEYLTGPIIASFEERGSN